MKIVFPCKGAIVLFKQDLETLKAFYNTNILTSKLLETYKNSNVMVQVGNLNYIPQKNSIILQDAKVLTINKMSEILGISNNQKIISNNINDEETNTISDNDLLSHPFFQTLKPLD